MSNRRVVRIDYTNYRGERRWRTIEPFALCFGSEHHPDEWVIAAVDLEKNERRDFVLRNIHETRNG